MNRPFKPVAPADAPIVPANPGASAPFVRIVMEDGKAYPISSEPGFSPDPSSQTGPASPSPVGVGPTFNDGWGTKPRCLTCGRGQAGCICSAPDGTEDMMPALDVLRIARRFGLSGWELAERSALR